MRAALRWARGLVVRRGGRLAAAALGVAVAVALLAALGSFQAASRATMTARAASSVAIDWQVQVKPGGSAPDIVSALRGTTGVQTALPVGFLQSPGLSSTTGGTHQSTGRAAVLGLPPGYRATFPDAIRTLVGSDSGVLLAQQTAANLHVAPGDQISIARPGAPRAQVTVAGVVELPQADSLFQRVGAPAQSQPVAPPDNVVLLTGPLFDRLTAPVARAQPQALTQQVHVALDQVLPPDPATAFSQSLAAANNFEAAVSGAAKVGNNLGAALDAAREDAAYSLVLFLFLGLPGAILAAVVTATVTSAGSVRRRREQSLLRTRGATRGQVLRLAGVEALLVGVTGSALGIALAALVGRLVFGTASFGATSAAALAWTGAAAAAGIGVAALAVLGPVRRDLHEATTVEGRAVVGREPAPRWLRFGVDFVLLALSLAIFWAAGRNQYALVLAPEGVPKLSISYWAFGGPALLWLGAALLTWRLSYLFLRHGRPLVARLLRPVTGPLAGTVAATMQRRRRLLSRAVVLIALAFTFAVSTATFNATYANQAEADAQLSNGADVTVTEPPGSAVGPAGAARLASVPGVRAVEPVQHRYAYVGADLQDMFGIDPATIGNATTLQDAYFQGGSASQLLDTLSSTPNGILVSAETVADFQLVKGDQLNLRLRDSRTNSLITVPFVYVGVVNEFPTAPKDSFLVANASYIAAQTGSDAVGSFLVDTAPGDEQAVAARLSQALGTSATVTDITQTRGLIGSSLTAVDLRGLSRVELGFAVVLVLAAAGLVLGLGVAERRRTFAIASALGARRRQLVGLVLGESAVVGLVGLLAGAALAWALSRMLVAVLSGVFDPPPAGLTVPWTYVVGVVAASAVGLAFTGALAARSSRRPAVEELRELR